MSDRFKFRYVFQHDETGRICCKEYALVKEIDVAGAELFRDLFKSGYSIIARCQCTGLRDKNGKLIFEGDVVEWVHFEKGKTTSTVEWLSGSFMQFPHDKDLCRSPLNCLTSGYTQVIGNIYENPELLEARDERNTDDE